MIMEVFCLLFFIIRVIHSGYVSVPQIFWKDTKNIMVIGIIVVSEFGETIKYTVLFELIVYENNLQSHHQTLNNYFHTENIIVLISL